MKNSAALGNMKSLWTRELFENSVTGPIYVDGAEPGDFVVEVLGIEVGSRVATTTVPGFGILEGWLTQTPAISKFSGIRGGTIVFPVSEGRSVMLPARPMIATIGVAPATESNEAAKPSRRMKNSSIQSWYKS